MRGRKPQPFAADVLDMREDGGDRTRSIPGRFGAPRALIQILDHNLIHLVVHAVAFREGLNNIEGNCLLS